jgi:hypothetical protein
VIEPAVVEAPAAEVRTERASTQDDRPARGKRGKNGVVAAPAPEGNREFWETWAEEKSTRPVAEEKPAPARDDRPRRDDRPARGARDDRPAAAPAREERPRRERSRRDTTRDSSEDAAPARVESKAVVADPGSQARLYVSLGKEAGVTADDVRALLGKDLGDDASRIGSVAMRATHCYVRVPEDLVERIVEAVSGTSHDGVEIKVELAKGG